MMALVANGLSKAFGAVVAVESFSLAAERGEFVSLLGPSGCGKTTVLRMLAGFETPSAGSVHIDGEEVTHLPPRLRRIGMVFQSYALFPNLTVEGNIGFGLKVAGMKRAEVTARVDEMLELIGLPKLRKRYPAELSGGQQQRVALARAVAIRPRILLLDEPLSALDAKIRVSLREDLRALQRALGITAVFVTHDQEEALALSHRIVVMSHGRVEQVGTPPEIYHAPATPFVAGFVGIANILDGTVLDADGAVRVGEAVLHAPAGLPRGAVRLGLRPEAIATRAFPEAENAVHGEVADASFLGPVLRLRVAWQGTTLTVDLHGEAAREIPAAGSQVGLWFRRDALRALG